MTWSLVLLAAVASALVLNELAAALVGELASAEALDETQGDWPRLPDDYPRSDGP